ncbi:MAG: S1C family serine protease [Spirochaetaceae bacterium]|jgi:S1-C subfamily serine protease|nr:S1C family serine protease [Spirochaetaceae bacterium]
MKALKTKTRFQKINYYKPVVFFVCFSCFSCASDGDARSKNQNRLEPPPPKTLNLRLNDIEKALPEDPARALHLAGVFSEIYGTGGGKEGAGNFLEDEAEKLEKLKTEALEQLKTMQKTAINEERWDDAASFARSLSALNVSVENSGDEAVFLLAEAKSYLREGKNLNAFLYAFRSNEISDVSGEDALLFLERAVEEKQRGTAAYFLAAAIKAGAEPPPSAVSFAKKTDSAQDMIKGVATVLVDRGIKIERGMGTPDRVLGSAFFVDSSGLLITNYHVIASEVDPTYNGYSKMWIRTGDSSSPRIPARVIGWDKTMDLALIKTEIKSEYVFSIIDYASPAVGETVLAIGSPGGLEKTVTSGIVSALGRRFLQIGDVIQIDAAVNHGNSGGPVIDAKGRLVGIVFAGIEQFQGLNFAVPAVRLASALPALIKGGKAKRPWLGLTLSESRNEIEVIYVSPYTPAYEQHLREGLFLLELDGRPVTQSGRSGSVVAALQDTLFPRRPGELVRTLTSDGKTRILQTAERPPLPLAEAAKLDTRERMTAPLFGIILEPLAGGFLSRSYIIKKVVRGSIADEAGLAPRDPVSIQGLQIEEKEGYALLDVNVKKRLSGYFETTMRLPAPLDSPDTL